MSKEKTYITEISMGMGFLDPAEESKTIKNVSEADMNFYTSLLPNHLELSQTFLDLGKSIKKHLLEKGTACQDVKWMGKKRITSVAAQDLEVDSISISIKEESNVITNGSPFKIIDQLTRGIIDRKTKVRQNWFLTHAKEELESYYKICATMLNYEILEFSDFAKKPKVVRKLFSKQVRELHQNKNEAVLLAYSLLCKKVSEQSALIFNQNLLTNPSEILTVLIPELFRIDDKSYLIAGIENANPFVLESPSLEAWKEQYQVLSAVAKSNDKNQPEIDLEFSFKNKVTQEVFTLELKIEIRWSHGKLNGNPEAKVYKKSSYQDIPWLTKISL